MHPLRSHRSYLAFLGHRLSGLALAAFLPLHFALLGSALDGEAALDERLAFTANPVVQVAEWGLVVLVTLHLLFGIRVLLLEFTRWSDGAANRAVWVIPSLVVALLVGVLYMIAGG